MPTLGIPDWAFGDLDPKTKKHLIKILARVAERAYRRGAQQGVHFARTKPQVLPQCMHDWRYCTSVDNSIGLDGFKTTSEARLFMETDLYRLGLSPSPKP